MSTSTPILASVPYSTLPGIPRARPAQASRSIDDLLDELDSESDSGYDEVNGQEYANDSSGKSKQPVINEGQAEVSSQLPRWFSPLVDGPSLCPEVDAQSRETETPASSSAAATAPACTDAVSILHLLS